MKKSITIFAVLVAIVSFGDSTSVNAIERLLNSRVSGSRNSYLNAADEVMSQAKKGKKLYGYVAAILSTEPDAPPNLRMDDETRNNYINACEGLLKTQATLKNNPMAWYLLSLRTGDTNTLKKAVDAGNVQALNAWGTLLVNKRSALASSTNEVNTLLLEAFNCFNSAANKKDVNGIYNTGTCYWMGIGVPKDEHRAFEYFKAAAKEGHPEAINNIGAFFREGIVVDKDLETSVKWFAKSASYGNPYGQFNYALALRKGEGISKDLHEAARLMQIAAASGCVEAIDAYGCMLWKGEGVLEDTKKAFSLFLQAAKADYPPAMENLSTCYQQGKGVEANQQKSIEWKIRSRAARGDRNAQLWLIQNNKLKIEEH